MNIQIFGKNKCFDTKKAERFFKERGVKFQSIDLPRFGMSAGEFRNVSGAVGGWKAMVDTDSPAYKSSTIPYLASEEDRIAALLENPKVFKTPIVRNGKLATIGYQPEVWKTWE